MAIRYRLDGGVDMRTTFGKSLSGLGGFDFSFKKLFKYIIFFPFYFIYYMVYYGSILLCFFVLPYLYEKGKILYGKIRTYYLNRKKKKRKKGKRFKGSLVDRGYTFHQTRASEES